MQKKSSNSSGIIKRTRTAVLNVNEKGKEKGEKEN